MKLYRQGVYHILAQDVERRMLEQLNDKGVCIMPSMKIANIKSTRICAFCRNWYDPTNAAIVPKAPQAGFFEYDPSVKNKCMLTGLEQLAWVSCGKFSCKF